MAGLAGAVACTIPVWGGWFETYDVLKPFVRAREVAQLWRLGEVLPVWSSTAQLGMGSPSPLLYHKLFVAVQAGLLTTGLGNGRALLVALILSLFAGFVIAAWTVRMVLGRTQRPIETACGLAAISCNFATMDWLVRGDFAELSATMLLPLVLAWSVRLIRDARFSVAIGPVMVLIALAHSGTATFCFVVLGPALGLAMLRWPNRIASWVRPLAASLAIFALGMLPFALPAVPMIRYAQIDWLAVISPDREMPDVRALFLPTPWRLSPLVTQTPIR